MHRDGATLRGIVAEFAGLFRTPTSAFQVHVGLPSPQTALLAYRGLRNRLSVLRALGAGSPYWHGRDSGLASAHSAIMRSYPRTTAPRTSDLDG
jgi:glutamate---cysteine ligase / carboxylate-amine ligase